MKLSTRTRNILRLFDYETWVTFEHIERYYKSNEETEPVSESRFIYDLQWHNDSIIWKFENEGKGYITLYGNCKYLLYEYQVKLFIKDCLRNYNSVTNVLRYAVY